MIKYSFFFIFFLLTFSANGGTINQNISKKYNQIFSEKILSEEDFQNYIKIFNFQDDCKFKLANNYIFQLDNKILMGHVLAHRYLHPNCYKSKYLELYYWLKKYNDHPQARRIYRLAVKRMPEGYKSPNKPSNAIGIKKENVEVKKSERYTSSKKLSKSQKREKKKLINTIKSRVNSGWPTGAVQILNQRDVNILLDQVELDQQKELIAKGYFLFNKDKLAIKFADEAIEKSSNYVPYAYWTAGLASWRLKNYKKAAEYFSNFSISLKNDVWHQASGSFWAARAYAKLNNYEEINFWLNRAATNPNSFYGIISSEILGIKNPIDWSFENNEDDLELFPAVDRIKALIQVGLISEIENEIVKINTTLNKEVAKWSLKIARHFDLAYTQLKVVGNLEKFGISLPIKYHYPTPIWQPRNNFTIEPALLYAFMHQESRFNKSAKSHRGAMGLMQIMPSTAKFISSSKDVKRNNSNILKIPEINLEVGQEYINYLLNLNLVNNNLIYLTAAYNGGPGNLQKWQKKTNYSEDPLFFMESIPSRETRWFIEKVLTKYWIYNNKFGKSSKSLSLLAKGKNPIY